MQRIKMSERVSYIGVNDRRLALFENMWPLPKGVSYNSYIIDDEKVVLIDTVERSKIEEFIENIKSIIGERPVDYLIVNHMEPDHSGGIAALSREYPNMKIVGNAKTFEMLKNFYFLESNLHEVKDGDSLEIGHHKLQFYTAPMVHWPETMLTYDETEKILFSSDAFGSFGALNGALFDDEIDLTYYENEMRRYYSNIVGKYGAMVQKAMKKLSDVEIKMVAPAHGPVWRSNLDYLLDKYDKWSKYETEEGVVIVYGTMYGNTEKMADVIARELIEQGIRNVKVYDASKTHMSYIISDLFKYKGFIVGSCAYNTAMFPTVEHLLKEIELFGVKNHLLGIFGSYAWSGGGVKNLQKFAENIKWDMVHEPSEFKGALKAENEVEAKEIAKAMADKLKSLRA